MTGGGRWRAGALLLAFAALVVAAPVVPAAADEAAPMYQPSTVDVIELTLSPEAIAKLEARTEANTAGDVLARHDRRHADRHRLLLDPAKVEVRLKGDASLRPIKDGKAAFKLKFKAAEAFLGLRKMTLNNMVEDPSMTHETLSLRGVPRGRGAGAADRVRRVEVNGEDFGLYLNIETLDKVALERRSARSTKRSSISTREKKGTTSAPAAPPISKSTRAKKENGQTWKR